LPIRFSVDRPATRDLSCLHIVIQGWCFSEGAEALKDVRAIAARRVYPGTLGVPRPDVAKVFGPVGAASGFEIPVILSAGRCQCRLEAQTESGAWQPFHVLEFRTPRSIHVTHALRWTKFWLGVWGGGSDWAGLPAAELEHAVAELRRTGRVRLGVWAQHSPRPLSPERFPPPRPSAGRLPRFTIVTPSMNHAEYLSATLRSVLEQPGVEVDYVIEDGGSKDGSVAVLKEISTRYGAPERKARLVRWRSEPDAGFADALRKGFAGAKGGPDDLMGWVNSDDQFMPGALRFVAEYFAAHPEVDVVYGHRVLVQETGLEIGRWFTPRMENDSLQFFDMVPQETLFWRRRAWERAGGIDPSFQFAADWDLLLRFRSTGARFARLPWFLGMFRWHPRQKTQAQINDVGMPEMDRLRLRELGSLPPQDELLMRHHRAVIDSTLVGDLFRLGIRI
jgi:GT2 family glycosyltransferase